MIETVGYGYDPTGNIVWLQQPCATVRYGYDAAYRCTTLTLPDGAVVTFDYDTANRRTDAHYPGGFHQHTDYDLSGRVTAVEARDNANTLLDRSTYRYQTDMGADSTLIREITGWFSPHPTGQPTLCSYDGLNRLTQAGPYAYTFDAATNLTSTNEHTFTINAADQYTHIDTARLGWDRAGQLTADEQQVISEYSATHQLTGTTGPEGRLAELAYATANATQLLEGLFRHRRRHGPRHLHPHRPRTRRLHPRRRTHHRHPRPRRPPHRLRHARRSPPHPPLRHSRHRAGSDHLRESSRRHVCLHPLRPAHPHRSARRRQPPCAGSACSRTPTGATTSATATTTHTTPASPNPTPADENSTPTPTPSATPSTIQTQQDW